MSTGHAIGGFDATDLDMIRRGDMLGPRLGQRVFDALAAADQTIAELTRERDEARALSDRLKLEAQCHASEARTANSTIHEIYQVLSGGKGEPGNWHGAEPARAFAMRLEAAEADNAALRERVAGLEGELRPIIGIENRTAQEVFDIMADRQRAFLKETDRG